MTLTSRIFRERQRLLIPLLGFLAANIVVLLIVVWPLQSEVDGAETSRQEALNRLNQARQVEGAARGQITSRDRAQAELKQFYDDVLPVNFSRASSLTNYWLTTAADAAGVKFKAGTWDPKPVRDSLLIKMTGGITLLGQYANILKFLYELETAEQFIIIEEVALSQPNATGDGPIELALVVSTYFKNPNPPAVK